MRDKTGGEKVRGEGGSLESFNEPALTPMAGRVSDKCVCGCVCA